MSVGVKKDYKLKQRNLRAPPNTALLCLFFFSPFFEKAFPRVLDLLREGNSKHCSNTQAQARNKMPLKEGEAAPNVRNSSDAVIQSMPMPMLLYTALH